MKITHERVIGIHLAVVYAEKVHWDCRKCGRLGEFHVDLF
jgi:hypothetical protein